MFDRGQAIPPLTVEEMHYAMTVHGATYTGRMQSEPIGKGAGTVAAGTWQLADIPINRAALALLDSMKHDPAKAAAALYRVIMVASKLLKAPEAKEWTRKTADGHDEISGALVESLATESTAFGAEPPVADVFKLAEKIRAQDSD